MKELQLILRDQISWVSPCVRWRYCCWDPVGVWVNTVSSDQFLVKFRHRAVMDSRHDESSKKIFSPGRNNFSTEIFILIIGHEMDAQWRGRPPSFSSHTLHMSHYISLSDDLQLQQSSVPQKTVCPSPMLCHDQFGKGSSTGLLGHAHLHYNWGQYMGPYKQSTLL